MPASEILELRQISASVVTEVLEDGSWSASVTAFLNNPVDGSTNPYQPNAATGRLLEVATSGDAGRVEMAERVGDDVAYSITQTARDAAPLLRIVTIGTDPEQVIQAFYEVHDLMSEELDRRQDDADVSPEERLSVEIVDAPVGVFDLSPPVDRAAFGVVLLGGALAFGLALVAESISNRRRMRTKRMLAVLDERPRRATESPSWDAPAGPDAGPDDRTTTDDRQKVPSR